MRRLCYPGGIGLSEVSNRPIPAKLDTTCSHPKDTTLLEVTSSQGLTLDPRKVATLAAGSRWVVEAHKVKGHKVVRETLETMNIGFTERQREDASLPSTITTAPLTAEQAEAFWDAIRVEDAPRFQVVASDLDPDIATPEPPDLDGLLDDLLAA